MILDCCPSCYEGIDWGAAMHMGLAAGSVGLACAEVLRRHAVGEPVDALIEDIDLGADEVRGPLRDAYRRYLSWVAAHDPEAHQPADPGGGYIALMERRLHAIRPMRRDALVQGALDL